MIREKELRAISGYPAAVLIFLALIAIVAVMFEMREPEVVRPGVIAIIMLLFLAKGLCIVNPNQGQVLQLFGKYQGTLREPGLKWVNPFYLRGAISLRVRNFESAKLKVNDQDGSPIEIAAVVVWRVVDTAEARFEVDDYQNYVHIQTEAALRNLAT